MLPTWYGSCSPDTWNKAHLGQPLQTTVVRIANKLDIFYILGKHNAAMTGKDLAQIVNADSVLLIRLLRYLAAMGAIKETGVDSYMANNITLNLTVLALKAGLNHTYDIVDTAGMALPAFLAKTNYRNPIDPKYCPFTEAYSTPEGLFEWFPKHPEYLHNFNLWMTGQRDGRVSWLDFFPFEQQLSKDFQGGDKAVMLVDIGGAFGHEVAAIKAKYPRLPGRFILQDLPDTVKQAIEVPGMEAMAHDFFTPQPIKGIASIINISQHHLIRSQGHELTISVTFCTTGPITNVSKSSPKPHQPWKRAIRRSSSMSLSCPIETQA